MFKKKSLAEKPRLTVMILVFIIFVAYIIFLIAQEKSFALQIVYGVLLVVFGGAFALSEVLRFINNKSICALIINCDTEKSLALAEKVDKADIFKSYTKANKVLRTLIYFDKGDFNALNTLIEHKTFQSSLESKYIYAYNKFFIAIDCNDRKNVTVWYKELIHIASTTIKGKSVPQIYSLDLISGCYRLFLGETDKAMKFMTNCYMDGFNNREIAFYYVTLAKLYAKIDNVKLEQKNFTLASEIAPNLQFVKDYKTV